MNGESFGGPEQGEQGKVYVSGEGWVPRTYCSRCGEREPVSTGELDPCGEPRCGRCLAEGLLEGLAGMTAVEYAEESGELRASYVRAGLDAAVAFPQQEAQLYTVSHSVPGYLPDGDGALLVGLASARLEAREELLRQRAEIGGQADADEEWVDAAYDGLEALAEEVLSCPADGGAYYFADGTPLGRVLTISPVVSEAEQREALAGYAPRLAPERLELLMGLAERGVQVERLTDAQEARTARDELVLRAQEEGSRRERDAALARGASAAGPAHGLASAEEAAAHAVKVLALHTPSGWAVELAAPSGWALEGEEPGTYYLVPAPREGSAVTTGELDADRAQLSAEERAGLARLPQGSRDGEPDAALLGTDTREQEAEELRGAPLEEPRLSAQLSALAAGLAEEAQAHRREGEEGFAQRLLDHRASALQFAGRAESAESVIEDLCLEVESVRAATEQEAYAAGLAEQRASREALAEEVARLIGERDEAREEGNGWLVELRRLRGALAQSEARVAELEQGR